MRIIKFKKNQKEIWNKFVAENNSESFLQAWEWGEFQKRVGKKVWRLGVFENVLNNKNETSKSQIPNSKSQINSKFKIPNSKLLAGALVIKYDLPFGRSYLYCPRGPAISQKFIKSKVHKVEVLNLLFDEIKKIAGEEKGLFLRFDPPVEMNRELRTPTLEKGVGGIFKKSPSEVQPRNTLILDITKSEEELLKKMKQKTRYNIRLSGKKELRIKNYELGIRNREEFKKKFEKFWELVKETSARDKFKSHDKNYYWKMLEAGVQNFESLRAKLYFAEYGNKIIAANIVLFFGDMAVYLHGASSNEYRNVMAPYLLQWRQILDAKKMGCKKYDFWGIENSQKSIKSKVHKVEMNWDGITRFKKGFGGYEKNYIGASDLVFSSIGYAMYKFVKSVKSKVRKVKSP